MPVDQDQRSAPADRARTKQRRAMRLLWSWRHRPSGSQRRSRSPCGDRYDSWVRWGRPRGRGRQPSLDLVENLRISGIAPKIMIELASAVIIAGSGRQHTQMVRQRMQPAAGLDVMILMVYLDAIQPVIMNESLQRTRREKVFPTPTPRMSDHREAARLVDEVDAVSHLDRVAGHVGRTPVGQKAVEGLLPIAHVPSLDQRVGDMRAPNRRTGADLGHH